MILSSALTRRMAGYLAQTATGGNWIEAALAPYPGAQAHANLRGGPYYGKPNAYAGAADLIDNLPPGEPTSAGLLVEPEATNSAPFSRDYTSFGTNGCTLSVSDKLDYDGGLMTKVTFSEGNNVFNKGGHVFGSTVAAISWYVRKGDFANEAGHRFGLYDATAVADIAYIVPNYDTKMSTISFGTAIDHGVVDEGGGLLRIWLLATVVPGNQYTIYAGAVGADAGAGFFHLGSYQAEDDRVTSQIDTDGAPVMRPAATPLLKLGRGAEKVTNGAEFINTDGWTPGLSSSVEIQDGRLRLTCPSTTALYAKALTSLGHLEAGETLQLNIGSAVKVTGGRIRASITSSDSSGNNSYVGLPILNQYENVTDFSVDYTASSPGVHYLYLWVQDYDGLVDVSFDEVSVRRVLPFFGATGDQEIAQHLVISGVPVDGVDRSVCRWLSNTEGDYILLWREGSTGLYRLESFVGGVSQGHVAVAGLDDAGRHRLGFHIGLAAAALSLRPDGGAVSSATATAMPAELIKGEIGHNGGTDQLRGLVETITLANGDHLSAWQS